MSSRRHGSASVKSPEITKESPKPLCPKSVTMWPLFPLHTSTVAHLQNVCLLSEKSLQGKGSLSLSITRKLSICSGVPHAGSVTSNPCRSLTAWCMNARRVKNVGTPSITPRIIFTPCGTWLMTMVTMSWMRTATKRHSTTFRKNWHV